MDMKFEELDDATRRYMLDEFEKEEAGNNPYRGRGLSAVGCAEFSGIVRRAIRFGNEETLIASLSLFDRSYWHPTEVSFRSGIGVFRAIWFSLYYQILAIVWFENFHKRLCTITSVESWEKWKSLSEDAPVSLLTTLKLSTRNEPIAL